MQEFYEQYWDRDTDVSDDDPTTPERKRRLLATLGKYIQLGLRVLDLGCGGGKFTGWIQEAGYEAVGMDISTCALEMAKSQNPDITFTKLNADGSIPAPDATFSAVWSTEVIEHLLEVSHYLEESRRVLQPGGILILTTPYHGRLKNVLLALFKFDRHFKPEGPHIRFFDRKGLERCLRAAEFEPVMWSGIGRLWKLYRTWFVVARKGNA